MPTQLQSGSTDNFGVAFTPVVDSDIDTATNRFIATGLTPTTYDGAGNITTDTKFRSLKYDYDANGRQSAVKLTDNTNIQSSVYDCSGQRVQTTAGGTTRTMVYDIFGQDVADYTGSSGGSLERENIYRGGQLLATQEYGQTSTENATWTNMTGVSASGNNLTKTASSGWGNGGAVSTQAISSGDGYAEFSADSLDYGMYGLSYGDTNQSYADIDFALYTERAEGRVYVYESGTLIGQYGTWTNGDRFRVAVESGVVKYYKNSTLLYTSSATLTYPLLVDTSLYSSNNTLTNVVISGNLSGGTGSLKYVLQDVQGSTRAAMNNSGSSSAVVARHDYLPFGEEISSGIGLRTTTQGYGGTDTNRQKYGLTERDDATGLDHTWFRKYENLSGRMTSPDPYNGSMTIGDPQSFNRYSYTQNDPVNFVDPSGLNMDGSQGSGYCIRYHYTNPSTHEGYWGNWSCSGGSGGGGGGGGLNQHGQNQQNPAQQQVKKKCKQDKNGGDQGDILNLLGRAELSGSISNIQSAGPKNPEGIVFNINNRQAFVDTLNSDPRFRHGTPFGGEHTGQVGGNISNTLDYRSFTTSDGLGIDSHGLRRSLQVDVGPTNPRTGTTLGYADLDCDNPAQDVVSAARHGFPIIFRRLAGIFRR